MAQVNHSSNVLACGSITHVALVLGHIHGMHDIRWKCHVVVLGLALVLLKLLLVQFLLGGCWYCVKSVGTYNPNNYSKYGKKKRDIRAVVMLEEDCCCTPLCILAISLL